VFGATLRKVPELGVSMEVRWIHFIIGPSPGVRQVAKKSVLVVWERCVSDTCLRWGSHELKCRWRSFGWVIVASSRESEIYSLVDKGIAIKAHYLSTPGPVLSNES
jgi:hypothetical protein